MLSVYHNDWLDNPITICVIYIVDAPFMSHEIIWTLYLIFFSDHLRNINGLRKSSIVIIKHIFLTSTKLEYTPVQIKYH